MCLVESMLNGCVDLNIKIVLKNHKNIACAIRERLLSSSGSAHFFLISLVIQWSILKLTRFRSKVFSLVRPWVKVKYRCKKILDPENFFESKIFQTWKCSEATIFSYSKIFLDQNVFQIG